MVPVWSLLSPATWAILTRGIPRRVWLDRHGYHFLGAEAEALK